MSKPLNVRVGDEVADWVESYAELRDVSKTQVVELALKELRALAVGGVPELPPARPIRRRAGRVRRCFECRSSECVTRVFLSPEDPPDLVPVCGEHGPMRRAENRLYLGKPVPA